MMKATKQAWVGQTRRQLRRSQRGAHAVEAGLRRQWALAAGGLLAVCVARGSPPAEIDDSKLVPPATVQIDFGRDIKPILTNNCYKCHSGERPKSHFLLTSRETAPKGGSQGVDIIAGQSAKSPLIHYVSGLVPGMEMPPEGTRRSDPVCRRSLWRLRCDSSWPNLAGAG